MSNEIWLEKFIKWNPEVKERITASISNVKLYCKDFKIGDNGICKHYKGCQIMINRTCSEECGLKINYISAEEFLTQPEKVQKVLLDWWKDNISILDFYKTRSILCGSIHVNNEEQIKAIKKFISDTIPLLKVDQLIKFIEDKTKYKVIFEYTCVGNVVVKMLFNNKTNGSLECKRKFNTMEIDLLQALWKVTIEIAKDN